MLSQGDAAALAHATRETLEVGTWTVADVALIDELSVRMGQVEHEVPEERSFFEIEELDGVEELRAMGSAIKDPLVEHHLSPTSARDRLLYGTIGPADEYAHVLVDEAQDLSPMQWRMIGRRGRRASWTVVGDVAQASWPDAAEADRARREAYGTQQRQSFHMTTNYRNAQEIFDYARRVILPAVPDADIPDAVRETGVHPVEVTFGDALDTSRPGVGTVAQRALADLAEEVEGSIAVITPQRHAAAVADLAEGYDGRVTVIDPLSTKGLEWDATLVVDPEAIVDESPGGARILYVVLTRAAHRMTVLRPTE